MRPLNKRKITNEDRLRALSVPISIFLESEGISLTRRGDRWTCNSPLTNEKNPSFVIYPENKFYCFSSGTGGDIISLVMLMRDVRFMDSIRILLNIYDNEGFDESKFDSSDMSHEKYYGKFELKSYVTSLQKDIDEIDTYASSRGFLPDTYLHCAYKEPVQIGLSAKFVKVLGIGFPQIDHYGNVCGVKMRLVSKNKKGEFSRFNQRGKPGFYLLKNIVDESKDPTVYIVESETSASSFHAYAVKKKMNTIIISFGGINQVPNSLPFKWEYLEKRILIIDFDGDKELWEKRINNFVHLNAEPLKIETVKGEDLGTLSRSGEIGIYIKK